MYNLLFCFIKDVAAQELLDAGLLWDLPFTALREVVKRDDLGVRLLTEASSVPLHKLVQLSCNIHEAGNKRTYMKQGLVPDKHLVVINSDTSIWFVLCHCVAVTP